MKVIFKTIQTIELTYIDRHFFLDSNSDDICNFFNANKSITLNFY